MKKPIYIVSVAVFNHRFKTNTGAYRFSRWNSKIFHGWLIS